MADVIHSDGGEMMRVIGGWPIDGEAIEILDVQTPEAQYQSRTWYVDNKRSRRCAAARAFARQVASIDGVREVWLLDSDEELEVAVVLADLNLDCEMRLRGSFIEIYETGSAHEKASCPCLRKPRMCLLGYAKANDWTPDLSSAICRARPNIRIGGGRTSSSTTPWGSHSQWPDWAMTALFYAAMHEVQAALVSTGLRPREHKTRKAALRKKREDGSQSPSCTRACLARAARRG